MPVYRKSLPLRVRLQRPDSEDYIEFFQTQFGDFDRVTHRGTSVYWEHCVSAADVAHTIYFCSELGYSINGGVKYEYQQPTETVV